MYKMSLSTTPSGLGSYRREIEAALSAAVQFDSDCPDRLREAIEYSLLAPGKRLRPQLVLMACDVCGGDIRAAMPAAVAVEMIHAYSLVHDDLPAMDDDDLRRGRPTCHKQFDEATATLVGDALQARAFELLAKDVHPPECAARCCAELGRAVGATMLVGGQAADLGSEFQQCSLAELEAIHRRKTGALFRVSLRLGAMIADASDGQLAALDDYGDNLGLAFQVIDDLLDVSGSENNMGKRLGKDAHKGKNTYPAILGIEASQALAEKLIENACVSLEIFGEQATPLRELALFVRQRNT
ncbi:Farnesyl diphosphate synthase [Bythopirellula polymerisocia]|uniref:Farnesyl diphosphate synthase n=2 Tax=Bythopirellula polymerisocia TaxID=2528003 RepID=A0A5C6CIB1_9BACT|nr:Farnesyl diphosphate synthase [Bythopirellula polymerisocia]